jgi:hypothetical protein
MSPEAWQTLDTTTRWLKYAFAAATTLLSVVSLRHDTTYKGKNPTKAKDLTPVGRKYLAGVLSLGLLTVGTTILGDLADSKVAAFKERDAQRRLAAVFQGKLDEQLNTGLKPILGELERQVRDTSARLQHDLQADNQRSTEQISRAQADLVRETLQSSAQVQKLNDELVASASRTSGVIRDTQSAMLEANRSVPRFTLRVILPSTLKNLSGQTFDWAEAEQNLQASAHRSVCPAGHVDYSVPRDDCDRLQRRNRGLGATHSFAQALYPGSGLELAINVFLRTLSFDLIDAQCSKLFPETVTQPCLKGTMQSWDESNGRDLPPPEQLGGDGTSLYAIVVPDEVIFQSHPIYGRDLLPKEMYISICANQEAPDSPEMKRTMERALAAAKLLPDEIELQEEVVTSEVRTGISRPINEVSRHSYTFTKRARGYAPNSRCYYKNYDPESARRYPG